MVPICRFPPTPSKPTKSAKRQPCRELSLSRHRSITAIAVMDRWRDKESSLQGCLFADFVGFEGVGGKRQMGTMLLHGTEGYQHGSAAVKSGLELGHGHLFYDHN